MSSRLAQAGSAYLRSAAHQPVSWYPWTPEAFERARAEGKPILLDIGAVWCHWCHVMDSESYESPAVAELLNRDWICIKVDRDERPDVDARYQRAVQALTGQGGWPLTAFLNAEGEVFFGGTYFPPDSRYGRPGFGEVLQQLAQVYREQPDRVAAQAAEIERVVKGSMSESRGGAISGDALSRGADAMAQLFDFRYGGFGTQPKFPHPGACEFLMVRGFDTRERWPGEIVDRTLTAMALGGVYDQLGGGFHRYSVDARWIVPHFEKMLYDNSELLRVYGHAAAAGTALFRDVVHGITGWLGAVMSDPAGGYYASQDADIGPGDDGDYFTWTLAEARSVVSEEELAVLALHYDLDESGEMHDRPGRNVLWVSQSVPEIAASLQRPADDVERLLRSGRAKMLAARTGRTTPFVDRTLYTSWGAMMASAVLEAAPVIEDPGVERHALLTLERFFRECTDGDGAGGARHAIGSDVAGLLEDQVHLAAAALDAFEATGVGLWRDRATRLMEHVWAGYRADGALLDTARGRGGEGFLRHEITPVQDAPTPSPNGVAGIVLARLAEHTGDERWRERQRTLLEACGGEIDRLGIHGATMLRALDWHVNPAAHVVVVGDSRDAATLALHRAARSAFRPRKVLTLLESGAEATRLPPALRGMIGGASPRAYVCAGPQCGPPAGNPGALAETLATFQVG